MKGSKLGGIVTIGTLVLGVVGIFAPMAWEAYKSTTALEVQMIALDTVVEASHERIEIRYNKEVIPSMSRMTVHIVNTGRNPVRHADRQGEPPKVLLLKVPDNVRLLDFSVDSVSRKNLKVEPKVLLGKANPPARREAPAKAEKAKPAAPVKYAVPGEVRLRLPVLHPQDYVRVSLLTAGHPGKLEVDGEFEGVREVQFFDRRSDYEGGRPKTPPSVGMVGFFSAMVLCSALFVAWPELLRGYRARAALEGGRFAIPSMSTRDAHLGYLEKELDFLPPAERHNLKRFLSDQPGVVDDYNRKEFERMALKAIRESKLELGVFVIFVTLALLGALYVVLMLL